ncbi:hypothetical protein OH76DRAFT_1363898 [Lentinus brumalis]|uniref:CigA protein n=1 Tax=Lentinus brumalis TaxID=2498619 RepID=A0A371CNB2_9APHY|nr:hypothetical protein OH76DRAFT_1363898 [Polyporus brumalis]
MLNASAYAEDARESPRLARQPHAKRNTKQSRSRSRTKTRSQKLYDKQLTALIMILLIAAGVTLYSAYIVFCATQRHHQPHLPTVEDTEAGQAVGPSLTSAVPITATQLSWPDQLQGYIAYLPHSGYHNQRIALENALVLARVLNRTLLLPPVRLGIPLTYVPFDELYEAFANSTKTGLEYCSQTVSYQADLPPECDDYMDYTHVSWDTLVDLPSIRAEQPILDGWNFTDAWLHDVLDISAASGDVFYLKDTTRNQYAFQDFSAPDPTARKFSESIHLAMLARRPERLIQLGTLFGSARLHLRVEANLLLRKHIRERMAFTHPYLVHAASAIRTALGGAYLGAHLRVADKVFEWSAPVNVRHAWWKLMHGVLGFTDDEILDMEEEFFPDEDALEPPVIEVDIPAMRSPHPPLPPLPADASPASGLSCRGSLHLAPALQKLNAPLFIATDARHPSLSPLLWRFIRTFPCSFFLDDFPEPTRSLGALRSEADGVPLGRFLMPFVDAMVVGQAWQVVGTEQSTFSTFVTDVLWRTYHGFEIVQRGSR